MKKFFTTIENWLLIIPLLIWLLEKTIVGYSTLDVHLHDTYFVFSNTSFGVMFLIAVIVPFGCHIILRTKSKGNRRLLLSHVLLSCLLCLVIIILFHYSIKSSDGLSGILFSIIIFMLLQLWLLLYTVFKLFSKSNTKSL